MAVAAASAWRRRSSNVSRIRESRRYGQMKKRPRRGLIVLALIAVAAVAAVAGYAYWTASGSGTGTATVGTDSGVDIVVTDMGDALVPGGDATVTFHVHNNSTTAPAKVGDVVLDTAVEDNGFTGLASGCLSSWFSFADVTVDTEVAAGGVSGDFTGTLHMDDPATNQDSCKNDQFDINLTTDNTGI
jgi:hypothetical protein